MVDYEGLLNAIEYFPDTGVFVWKINRSRAKAGSIAGSLNRKGYWRIGWEGEQIAAHRLAWLIMTGEWPASLIDHVDLDKRNNRWRNLRLATPTLNNANAPGHSKLYPKGVSLHASGRFQAQIKCKGLCHYLGLFDTAEGAHAAYVKKAGELFGEFARAA